MIFFRILLVKINKTCFLFSEGTIFIFWNCNLCVADQNRAENDKEYFFILCSRNSIIPKEVLLAGPQSDENHEIFFFAVVIVSFNENNMKSIIILISLFSLVNSGTIEKRQVQIPIQISGNLDVGIGTQCVLNGRTYKSG